jgi:phage terminase large subunit-like protein
VAGIRWTQTSAGVQAVGVGADDPVLVEIMASDKAGIDCPLGWPQRFIEFVAQHQAGVFVASADVAGKDWRRQLAFRQTDLIVRPFERASAGAVDERISPIGTRWGQAPGAM